MVVNVETRARQVDDESHKTIYRDVISKVKGSNEFRVQAKFHQGSVLNLLLFIIVLHTITGIFKMGFP